MPDLLDALARDNDVSHGALPARPPGLTGDDVPLYSAWLAHPCPVPSLGVFNVRVGPPLADLVGDTGPDARMLAQLYAPRIDLLIRSGATWWILEFHGQLGLPQLGRLIAYRTLLQRTYGPIDLLRSAAIAHTPNPYLVDLFTQHAILAMTYTTPGLRPTILNP